MFHLVLDGVELVGSSPEVHVRVADGKVIEAWQNWDMLGMMQQIQSEGKKAATYIGAP